MRVLVVGTGLIGASIGLALKSPEGFSGEVLGWDANPEELATALRMGAIDGALESREAVLQPDVADVVVLATPVLPILDWMEQLAPNPVMTSFLASCTPGYYNNEGQGPSPHSLLVGYSGGAPAYFRYIDEWRTSGEFAGLEFTAR